MIPLHLKNVGVNMKKMLAILIGLFHLTKGKRESTSGTEILRHESIVKELTKINMDMVGIFRK